MLTLDLWEASEHTWPSKCLTCVVKNIRPWSLATLHVLQNINNDLPPSSSHGVQADDEHSLVATEQESGDRLSQTHGSQKASINVTNTATWLGKQWSTSLVPKTLSLWWVHALTASERIVIADRNMSIQRPVHEAMVWMGHRFVDPVHNTCTCDVDNAAKDLSSIGGDEALPRTPCALQDLQVRRRRSRPRS